MSNEQNWIRIARYLAGELSEQELQQLLADAEQDPELAQELEVGNGIWTASAALPKAAMRSPEQVQAAIALMSARLDEHVEEEPIFQPRIAANRTNIYRLGTVRIAAAIAVMLMATFALYRFVAIPLQTEEPWSVVATLPGEQRQVALPDGTQVRLNYATQLSYAPDFMHNRRVRLEGEAFFEVAHADAPFIVQTEQALTRVVGTAFNVRAYAKETETVQVTEGRVVVASAKKPQDEILLKAGDALSVSESLELQPIVAADATAWQENRLVFRNAPLKEVLSELERCFDLKVEVQGELPEQHFTGELDAKKTEDSVKKLALAFGFTYKLDGNKLLIKV